MADSCVVSSAEVPSRRRLWRYTGAVAIAVSVSLVGSAWLDPPDAIAQEDELLAPEVSDDVLVVFEFADFETQVFSELQGITSEIAVIDPPPRRPRVDVRVSAVVSRPLSADLALWDWHQRIIKSGKIQERRSGSIVVLDLTGEEISRWSFLGGYPSFYGGVMVGNNPFTETVTMQFEKIERVSP